MVLKNPNKYTIGRTIVYFVRHGDRIHVPNSPDIGLQKVGPGLSALGKKQAKAIAKNMKKIKAEIDVLYSSNMKRAIETANIIGKAVGKKPKVVDGLSEFNNIVWSYKLYHHHFWKHFIKHRKGVSALNKILRDNKGKVIVIVAHGNMIRGLVGNKFGLSLSQTGKLGYHNCHVSLVSFIGTKLDYIDYFNSNGLIRGFSG